MGWIWGMGDRAPKPQLRAAQKLSLRGKQPTAPIATIFSEPSPPTSQHVASAKTERMHSTFSLEKAI